MEKQFMETPIVTRINVCKLITIYNLKFDTEFYHARPFECHDFYEIVAVEAGEYHAILDGVQVDVMPSEVILFAPGTSHGPVAPGLVKNDALVHIISFRTTEKLEADIFNKPIKLQTRQQALLSQLFSDVLLLERKELVADNYKGMTFINNSHPYVLQKIKNVLELLLIELCERFSSSASVPPMVQGGSDMDLIKVTTFLRNHITKRLTLDEIADGCLMSVPKLKKLFSKNDLGGVIDYFNSLKVNAAKQMIINNDMSFAQIAESLGFPYPHNFSKIFKNRTGFTPSQYAKSIGKTQEMDLR